jgi:GUN4-like
MTGEPTIQSTFAVDGLRDLLKAGEWKQADRETLAVMLKATGREKEGYLSSESIENFPCTDLHTIDQLWLRYSNGRFGFSVQKRIWESVGKNYDKFGDHVGWRRKGMFGNNWLQYEQCTFTTNAPQGHLPTVIKSVSLIGTQAVYGVLIWGRVESVLFSRIEICKL